jgi:homoserine O-acetyltransferase
VVWVFHALTANSNPQEWWPGVVGPGALFDPEKYFIVCANMLGSCYGSTGPPSQDPDSNDIYGPDFPLITIEDMVAGHKLLAKHLNVDEIFCGIGGSMGGQQLLEWAVQEPDRFQKIIPIATNARHSAWGIAFNSAQRQAIESDPSYFNKTQGAGDKGLQAARAIAMLSYRNQRTYNKTQSDEDGRLTEFSAESYQRYQGKKLSKRFDAHSYYALSKAMDSHNAGRNHGGIPDALARISSEVLAIGISSDLLFPVHEQIEISQHCRNGSFVALDSFYGHDGFLIEHEKLRDTISPFLES